VNVYELIQALAQYPSHWNVYKQDTQENGGDIEQVEGTMETGSRIDTPEGEAEANIVLLFGHVD
jgi:hypothetical protein